MAIAELCPRGHLWKGLLIPECVQDTRYCDFMRHRRRRRLPQLVFFGPLCDGQTSHFGPKKAIRDIAAKIVDSVNNVK
jgi:hypothetical protein